MLDIIHSRHTTTRDYYSTSFYFSVLEVVGKATCTGISHTNSRSLSCAFLRERDEAVSLPSVLVAPSWLVTGVTSVKWGSRLETAAMLALPQCRVLAPGRVLKWCCLSAAWPCLYIYISYLEDICCCTPHTLNSRARQHHTVWLVSRSHVERSLVSQPDDRVCLTAGTRHYNARFI